MKKIAILLIVFLGSLTLIISGCGNKNSSNTIRLSEVTHSLFYAPLYVAINNGYFEDEGLDIELTNAGGSDTVASSLLSGSADIGLMGPESVVYLINNGMTNAPTIFAQLTACDGSFLVGRTEDNNFDWNSLKNSHIIAGRQGGMPAMTLQYILNNNYNLTTSYNETDNADVYLDISISFNLTSAAFLAGTGDYCTMFDPTASQCEENGTGYIVAALGDEVSDIPYTVFVANSSYLSGNSENVDKFMSALKRGYNYLMSATDDEILSALRPSFSTTSDSLILASVKNYISIGAYASNFVLKESSWNTMLDIIDNAGELTSRVSWNSAVNTSFASKVESL